MKPNPTLLRLSALLPLALLTFTVACSPSPEETPSEMAKTNDSSQEAAANDPPARMYSPEAFRDAALNGKLRVVEICLGEELDVNQPDQNGITPLAAAAYNGHTEIVKLLLENGAEVDARDGQGNTPLIHASGGQHPETVQTLLDAGAEVNAIDSGEGFSALMMAASLGNSEVVKVLLQAGADADLTDEDGDTALTFARKSGHAKIVMLLSNE
ncbi:MAG: ankyrin repeat domain-containing protein [Planctomycetota bacterium]